MGGFDDPIQSDSSIEKSGLGLDVKKIAEQEEEERLQYIQDETTPEYKELKDRLSKIDLANKTEEKLVPELNYLFEDYGFKFEQAEMGNAVKVIAPNDKETVINYSTYTEKIDPTGLVLGKGVIARLEEAIFGASEGYEDELSKFIKENRKINENVDLEKKKFISDKEVKEFTKSFNNNAKVYVNKTKELEQQREDIMNRYKNAAPGTAEYQSFIEEKNAFEAKQRELKDLQEKLKEQGKQYDKYVGEYAAMRVEQGSGLGQILDSAKSGFGGAVAFATDYTLTALLPLIDGSITDKDLKEIKYGKEEKFINPFSKKATAISRDMDKGFVESVKDLAFLGGRLSSKEYLEDVQSADLFSGKGLLGVLYGVAEFVPVTMATGGFGTVALSSQYVMEEMNDNVNFDDVSEAEKAGVALAIGATVGLLEKVGFKNIMQSKALTPLSTSIAMRVLGKNPATMRTFNEYVNQEVKSLMAKGALKIGAGFTAEFETGAAQEAADIGLKKVYNAVKGSELFDTPDDVLYEIVMGGIAEGIGGAMMATPGSLSTALKKNQLSEIDNNTFELFEQMSKDTEYLNMVTSKLDQQVVNQEITKEDRDRILDDYNRLNGAMQKLPDGIKTSQKKQLLGLYMEHQKITDAMQTSDEVFNKRAKKEKLNIENRIDALLKENKVETDVEETLNTQPDETKVFYAEKFEDIPEQHRENARLVESDGSDITFREKVLGLPIGKEKNVKVGEYYTYTLNGNEIEQIVESETETETVDESQESLLDSLASDIEAKVKIEEGEITSESQIEEAKRLKAEIAEAEKSADFAKVEELTKKKNELELKIKETKAKEAKVETKVEPPVQRKVLDALDTEVEIDGKKGFLKQDGERIVFETTEVDPEVQKEIDRLESSKRRTEKSEKMRGFDVSKAQLNKQYDEQIAKLKQKSRKRQVDLGNKNDLMFSALSDIGATETQLSDVEKITFEGKKFKAPPIQTTKGDYISGEMELISSKVDRGGRRVVTVKDKKGLKRKFTGETADKIIKAFKSQQPEPKGGFFSKRPPQGTVKVSDNVAVIGGDSKLSPGKKAKYDRIVNMAQKAIDALSTDNFIDGGRKKTKGVFPDLKILIHTNESTFEEEIGERARGAFDPATNTIHINLALAKSTTVGHEVLHAILVSRLKTDRKIAIAVNKMIDSIKASVPKDVAAELEAFVKGYKGSMKNEEYIAELFGILSERYNSLPNKAKRAIRDFIRAIQDLFNLPKSATIREQEVFDFITTMARKVGQGEVVQESDLALIEDVDKEVKAKVRKEEPEVRKQKVDDLSVLSFVSENLKELENLSFSQWFEKPVTPKHVYLISNHNISKLLGSKTDLPTEKIINAYFNKTKYNYDDYIIETESGNVFVIQQFKDINKDDIKGDVQLKNVLTRDEYDNLVKNIPNDRKNIGKKISLDDLPSDIKAAMPINFDAVVENLVPDSETHDQLKQLLKSDDESNISLAIELIKGMAPPSVRKQKVDPKIEKLKQDGVYEGIVDFFKSDQIALAEQLLEGQNMTLEEFVSSEGVIKDMDLATSILTGIYSDVDAVSSFINDQNISESSDSFLSKILSIEGVYDVLIEEIKSKIKSGDIKKYPREARRFLDNNIEGEKEVLQDFINTSFKRKDSKTGEPTSLRTDDGYPLARTEGGQYINGDFVFESFDQLTESMGVGFFATELTLEEEAELRNEEVFKEQEQELKDTPSVRKQKVDPVKEFIKNARAKGVTVSQIKDYLKRKKGYTQAEVDALFPKPKKKKKHTQKSLKELISQKAKNTTKGNVSVRTTNNLLKKAEKLDYTNEKAVEAFAERVAKIYDRAGTVKEINTAKSNRTKAKDNLKKSKLGASARDFVDAANKILSIKVDFIPIELLEEYNEVMAPLAKTEKVKIIDIDTAKMQDLLVKIQEQMEEIAEAEVEKNPTKAEKNRKDNIKNIKSRRGQIKPNLSNKFDNEFAEFLLGITDAQLDQMSAANIDVLKNLYSQIEQGYLSTSLASEIKKEVEGKIEGGGTLLSKLNLKKAGKFYINSMAKIYTKLRGVFSDDINLLTLIRSTALTEIDTLLGNLNAKDIYNKTFGKLSSAKERYDFELANIMAKLDKFNDLVSGGKVFKALNNQQIKSKFRIMASLLQDEFEANPGAKGVASAIDYINATSKKLEKSKKKRDRMEADILLELKKEIEDKGIVLSKREVKAKNILKEINNDISEKFMFVAALRGQTPRIYNSYIHHSALYSLDNQKSLVESQSNALMNPSTKAGTTNDRSGNKVISFDPAFSTLQGVKQTLLDFHMTQPLKEVRASIAVLENSNKKDIREVGIALDQSLKESLEIVLSHNLSYYGMAEKVLDNIRRLSYYATLGSVPRAFAELGSNMSYAMLSNPKSFTLGSTKYKYLSLNVNGAKLMNQVGSTITTKNYSKEALSGSRADSATFNRSAFNNSKPKGRIAEVMQFMAENTLVGPLAVKVTNVIAEKLITTPDIAIARPLWFGTFFGELQSLTGKNFTKKQILEMAEGKSPLLNKYKKEVEQARIKADKENVQMSGSSNTFDSILKDQVRNTGERSSNLLNMFRVVNSYMARFVKNEHNTFKSAIYALFNAGDISRPQAIALTVAVTTRMAGYMVLYTMFKDMFFNAFDDDEDEKDTDYGELAKRQLTGSFVTLMTRRSLGNIPYLPIALATEYVNENYLEDLRNGKDYDPFENSLVYSPVNLTDLKSKQPLDLWLAAFGGPFGPLLKSASRMQKVITRMHTSKKKSTRDKYEKEFKERMLLELVGNLGLLPFYKDIRTAKLKKLFEDSGNKKSSFNLTDAEKKKYMPELYRREKEIEKRKKSTEGYKRMQRKKAEIKKKREEMIKRMFK